MSEYQHIYNIAISAKSHKLLNQLLHENPQLAGILKSDKSFEEVQDAIKTMVLKELESNIHAVGYYKYEKTDISTILNLRWSDYGAIRILDYLNNSQREFNDLNLRGEIILNNPFKHIWLAAKFNKGGATPDFFEDMIHLFRQFSGKSIRELPDKEKVEQWMNRYPSGLEPEIIKIREQNKDRIIKLLIKKIDDKILYDITFYFEEGLSYEQKYKKVSEWWDTKLFHLRFALRTPDLLNEFLDNSLSDEMMENLCKAKEAGVPFFINPYYLSLINVNTPEFAIGADYAIRDYMFYSKQLVEEFGQIKAWEKEDIIEAGKPNVAGWILPSEYNIHRRYPDVAILIPDMVGKSCAGLCASCQRMYDFQRGHLKFDKFKLKNKIKWSEKQIHLLKYFEEDSQLQDILITGGDIFMSSDKKISRLLDAVYEMAINKRKANELKNDGEKYAEMQRIRLGTRLLAYLPQRVTFSLSQILKDFKEKAKEIGFKQFIVQTHFQSPIEITPEAKKAVSLLLSAGWMVTNQTVFTTSASRRGHTSKLRKVLNDIGVLTYYTFTVKGYKENTSNFATNARTLQELVEEKVFGRILPENYSKIEELPADCQNIIENINKIRRETGLAFLSSDRNVLNLPGVGKSLTFRVIGITHDGRRILEFDYDPSRRHSPILNKLAKVIIIESKSISHYLQQLDSIGEDIAEYQSIYGYTIGNTEPKIPIYEYPTYNYNVTKVMTNLINF